MVWRACGHHIVLYDWLATLEAAFCCQGFCLPPTLEVVLYRIASFVSSYPPGVGVAPSAYGARKLPSSHSPRWAQAVAALQLPNNNNGDTIYEDLVLL
jgi:hypothetical protein